MLYFDNWVRKSYKLLLFWFEKKKLNHRGEKRHFLVTQQETF